MSEREPGVTPPRDPQSFTRGDKRAVTIFVSIGLAVTAVLLGIFVVVVVMPAV